MGSIGGSGLVLSTQAIFAMEYTPSQSLLTLALLCGLLGLQTRSQMHRPLLCYNQDTT